MTLSDPLLYADFFSLFYKAVRDDLSVDGDVSSEAFFSREETSARVYSRQEGVLSGLETAEQSFLAINPKPRRAELEVVLCASDGDRVKKDTVLMEISGRTVDILKAERIALNFIGFFSGIATQTAQYCSLLKGTGIGLLDTRKTLPSYRRLSKAAVRDGGGINHRMGLYDMVIIKDNHIKAAGSIKRAVKQVRKHWGRQYTIEVECTTLAEVRKALSLSVDCIMLDNMTHADCARAIELREEMQVTSKFEASGDFTMDKVRLFSDLKLDFISVGALTHSVENFNVSLLLE